MHSKIEIFCGTGGVGKTTLSTARAISLTKKGNNCLLITIDPSHRLKDYLKISEIKPGQIYDVANPQINNTADSKLSAMLMDVASTTKRIAQKSGSEKLLNSKFINILTSPFGGLNEIFALVELYMQYEEKKYDYIILDTPPGGHFIDFLQSINKIRRFFDSSFIEIFNHLNQESKNISILKKVVASGAKTLLSYLKKVTSEEFIDDFLEAVYSLHDVKDIFLKTLSWDDLFENDNVTRWFLIGNYSHDKISDILHMQDSLTSFKNKEKYICLNRSNFEDLSTWEPSSQVNQELKQSLLSKELKVNSSLRENSIKFISFLDIHSNDISLILENLSTQWSFQKLEN
ncbi:AAA family ATPase [Bacteriovoracaceae bacterium]|nr:AAA family ATPase [Bacteriovoracaceae bacterium]